MAITVGKTKRYAGPKHLGVENSAIHLELSHTVDRAPESILYVDDGIFRHIHVCVSASGMVFLTVNRQTRQNQPGISQIKSAKLLRQ
jgi:hypothetical protein